MRAWVKKVMLACNASESTCVREEQRRRPTLIGGGGGGESASCRARAGLRCRVERSSRSRDALPEVQVVNQFGHHGNHPGGLTPSSHCRERRDLAGFSSKQASRAPLSSRRGTSCLLAPFRTPKRRRANAASPLALTPRLPSMMMSPSWPCCSRNAKTGRRRKRSRY